MGKLDQLLVSEVFYSLQGEGSTMGIPSVFLRLGGCNLFCDGAWRCDTIEVWQKGEKFPFQTVLSTEQVHRLRRGAHLIITGGEPLLQQESIVEYLKWFSNEFNIFPFVEIETNGTILPNKQLSALVDLWNVSPKLKSSGESVIRRVKTPVLSHFNKMNTIFKFVIVGMEDWLEIADVYLMTFVIDKNKIWLMPAASTIKELLEKNQVVSKIALEKQVNFCTRLQVEIWNKTTGV